MAVKYPTPVKALTEIAEALGLERVADVTLRFGVGKPPTATVGVVLYDEQVREIVAILKRYRLEPIEPQTPVKLDKLDT